jgi:hypothetical protein
MSKIYQLIIGLLIEKGYKLTKDLIYKLIDELKNRKKVKECLNEKTPQEKAKCLSDELNRK